MSPVGILYGLGNCFSRPNPKAGTRKLWFGHLLPHAIFKKSLARDTREHVLLNVYYKCSIKSDN